MPQCKDCVFYELSDGVDCEFYLGIDPELEATECIDFVGVTSTEMVGKPCGECDYFKHMDCCKGIPVELAQEIGCSAQSKLTPTEDINDKGDHKQ